MRHKLKLPSKAHVAAALRNFVGGGDAIGTESQVAAELGGQPAVTVALRAGWVERVTYIEWTVDGRERVAALIPTAGA